MKNQCSKIFESIVIFVGVAIVTLPLLAVAWSHGPEVRQNFAEKDIPYSIKYCQERGGIPSQDFTDTAHNKVSCALPNGTVSTYQSEFGFFYVKNDIEGKHKLCLLTASEWRLDERTGAGRCFPKTPKKADFKS